MPLRFIKMSSFKILSFEKNPCSGPTCEIKEETDYGTECENNSDCSSEGQYCDPTSKQCKCNQGLGYILDEFQPSLTYGECVGPVPQCETSQDCEFGQSCLFGFCACLEGQKLIKNILYKVRPNIFYYSKRLPHLFERNYKNKISE